MLITSIEKQKRSQKRPASRSLGAGRWNIYVDGDFFCGLYADTIMKYGLHVNDEFSETKLHEIRDYDEYIYGKEIALNFLSYRIRTSNEIKKKLREKKISVKIIGTVMKYLEDSGLIDDEEFAELLIEENIKRNPVGIRVLKQKLYEKGVPKQVGERAMEKVLQNVDEKQLAMANFTKLLPKIKNKDKTEQKRKTYEFLTRKGFGYDVINEIIYEKIK